MRRHLLLVCSFIFAGGCGCTSDVVAVSGRVTLDGQPLAGAVVTFQPLLDRGKTTATGSVGHTDSQGQFVLRLISPDRPALVTDRRAITNHPETVEWPEHSAWVGSVERLDLLQEMSSAGADDVAVTEALLQPPLPSRSTRVTIGGSSANGTCPQPGRLTCRASANRARARSPWRGGSSRSCVPQAIVTGTSSGSIHW